MEIAVIGAGLAGLGAAADLVAAGHGVVVWEKSRGVGGRTATRRAPGGLRFDHGAPFLHDGGEPLTGLLASTGYELLARVGVQPEVVGDGANNAPAKAIAEHVDVRAGVRVAAVRADASRWRLADERGESLGAFDAVLVTAPAPQAGELLAEAAPALAHAAASVAYDPCWAVMAAWSAPLGLAAAGASGERELAWAVAEAPKPGRAPGER